MLLLNGKQNARPHAMYVGGCVRDYVLGIPIKDIDIATTHTPDMATKILKQHFKILPIGIDHGTIVAITPIGNIQITTLRRDVQTNGRHATVSFTDNWIDDAMRRDFTINTLLMDANGKIIDPLQMAFQDLKRGMVRFVGEPQDRVREDVLRILRYVRFQARFGRGALNKDYLKIFMEQKTLFHKLSRERITEEIFKTVHYSSAFKYFQQFEITKLLLMPRISKEQIKIFEKLSKINLMTPELALTLWANGSRVKWAKIKSYLRLSNNTISHINDIISGQKVLKKTNRQNYLVLLYRYKCDVARHIIIYSLAQQGISAARLKLELKKFDELQTPIFPISGKDLIVRGFRSGPELGVKLRMLENKWIKSGFKSASLDAVLRQ